MWRIVALGAVPAALLGVVTGMAFQPILPSYRPMGQIYLAQDTITYGGGAPPYVAPGVVEVRPMPAELAGSERPPSMAALDQVMNSPVSQTEWPYLKSLTDGDVTTPPTYPPATFDASPATLDAAAATLDEPKPSPLHGTSDAIEQAFNAQNAGATSELGKAQAPKTGTNLDASLSTGR